MVQESFYETELPSFWAKDGTFFDSDVTKKRTNRFFFVGKRWWIAHSQKLKWNLKRAPWKLSNFVQFFR